MHGDTSWIADLVNLPMPGLDHFTLVGFVTNPVPFPALKHLVITTDLTNSNVEAFQHALAVRKGGGYAPRILSFFNCDSVPNDLASGIQDVVDNYSMRRQMLHQRQNPRGSDFFIAFLVFFLGGHRLSIPYSLLILFSWNLR